MTRMTDQISEDTEPQIRSNEKLERTVSIAGEREHISKKLVTQEFVIEKRWVKKMIQVPVAYEEVFVNGKRLGSKGGVDALLQSLSALTKNKGEKEKAKDSLRRKEQQTKRKGQAVPLTTRSAEIEKILPLFTEKIIVNRRIVKYAEAVITKKAISETKKVKVQLKGEKVILRYPDGTERTLESTAPAPQVSETA